MNPIIRKKVTVAGKPDAERTMIFSHGLGTDQSVWRDIWPAFANDFRIVLYDHAGAGESDPEAFVQHRYLKLASYATDLLDICASLALRSVILVGHSMGAMINMLAAIQQPERFIELILIGASPRYLDDDNYHGGLTKPGIDAIYRAMYDNRDAWANEFTRVAVGKDDSTDFARRFAATLKSIPEDRLLTVASTVFQSDHRADLPKIVTPTLIIQASHDFIVPMDVANYLHTHIKGSRLCIIEAEGHLPHVTAPAEVVRTIRSNSFAIAGGG